MKSFIFTLVTILMVQAAFACSVSFTTSVSGATATFTVSSTPPTYSGPMSIDNMWYYGDASSGSANSHTYATAGTHAVALITTWRDSLTNAIVCQDSVVNVITTGTPPPPTNQITGNIIWDTLLGGPNPAFKVWLIQYDAATQDLYAVDSLNVSAAVADFSFNNEPAGSYLLKAAQTNGPSSGTGLVPTYSYDSLYWSSAHTVVYSGTGLNSGNNILMQHGTVTSGPGFISGSITSGANKGTKTTGASVANVTVLLEDMSGKVLAYNITDGNGDYSFPNLPAGTYKVYPEILGYATTPAIVTIGGPVNDINFTQHTISQTITPANVGVATVAANNSTFNIFPNPGNGVFNITWSSKTALQQAHANVTDVAGRRVLSTDLNMNAATGNTQLNLSQLNPGVYFININAGNVSYTNKVVLQH